MDWSSDVCSSDLLVPSDAAALIQDQLVNVAATAASKAGLGLALALFFPIYGATRASGAIIPALGVIYAEEAGRSNVRGYLLSVRHTLLTVTAGVEGLSEAELLAAFRQASHV